MDPAELEAAVEADPKVLMVRDANGETPLHLAMHGKPALVKMLVEKGIKNLWANFNLHRLRADDGVAKPPVTRGSAWFSRI